MPVDEPLIISNALEPSLVVQARKLRLDVNDGRCRVLAGERAKQLNRRLSFAVAEQRKQPCFKRFSRGRWSRGVEFDERNFG